MCIGTVHGHTSLKTIATSSRNPTMEVGPEDRNSSRTTVKSVLKTKTLSFGQKRRPHFFTTFRCTFVPRAVTLSLPKPSPRENRVGGPCPAGLGTSGPAHPSWTSPDRKPSSKGNMSPSKETKAPTIISIGTSFPPKER